MNGTSGRRASWRMWRVIARSGLLSVALLVLGIGGLTAAQPRAHGTGVLPIPAVQRQTAVHTPKSTFDYKGSMSSTVHVTMTGAFAVRHITNLDWTLPYPAMPAVDGVTFTLRNVSFVFDQPPSASNPQVDVLDGNKQVTFHWDAPKDHAVIHLKESFDAVVTVNLSPVQSTSKDLSKSTLSDELQKYLKLDPSIQLPPSVQDLLKQLKTDAANHQTCLKGKLKSCAAPCKPGSTSKACTQCPKPSIVKKQKSCPSSTTGGNAAPTEEQLVVAIDDWIATHIKYDPSKINGSTDAASAFQSGTAACWGYSNLLKALLLKAGIPAQIQLGWVLKGPENMPVKNGKFSIKWTNGQEPAGLHSWVYVYFPDKGWEAFDPQAEKFFVDPRHIPLMTEIDAGQNVHVGGWSADANPGDTGYTGTIPGAPTGYFEVVPGNGPFSVITVAIEDHNAVQFAGTETDQNGLALASRQP